MATTSLRVSSEQFPPGDPVEFLRETYGRTVLKVDFEPIGYAPVVTDLVLRQLPGLGVASGYCSPLKATHTAQLADSDDLVLLLVSEGSAVMRHRGREEHISDGEALLTTAAEFGCNHMLSAIRCVNLAIPHRVLAPMLGDLAQVLMRPIRHDNDALRLLASYFRALDDRSCADPQLARAIAGHVHELVALAVGKGRDARELVRGRGVSAARMRLIKEDIAVLLAEPALSAELIAGRQGVSERYVRKLFEREGSSFSAYVLAQRLALVRRWLGETWRTATPISSLAYAAGFNDLSYFNKVFRRAYGMTPSEARAAAQA